MDYLHQFLYGIYPYIAFAIFLLGSLARFEREQYTWKSDSSQMLKPAICGYGKYLLSYRCAWFVFGHLVGLLTPVSVWDALGVSHGFKQMIAIVMGGTFGSLCMFGFADFCTVV